MKPPISFIIPHAFSNKSPTKSLVHLFANCPAKSHESVSCMFGSSNESECVVPNWVTPSAVCMVILLEPLGPDLVPRGCPAVCKGRSHLAPPKHDCLISISMLAQYIKKVVVKESKLRVVTLLHIVHTNIEQY